MSPKVIPYHKNAAGRRIVAKSTCCKHHITYYDLKLLEFIHWPGWDPPPTNTPLRCYYCNEKLEAPDE